MSCRSEHLLHHLPMISVCKLFLTYDFKKCHTYGISCKVSTEHHLSLLSSPRIEPWVLSKLRSEASSMEQVESSWTGERPSPAPGENMATAFLMAKEAYRRCSLVLVSSFMVSPLWLMNSLTMSHFCPIMSLSCSAFFFYEVSVESRSLACSSFSSSFLTSPSHLSSSVLILRRRHVKHRLPRIVFQTYPE